MKFLDGLDNDIRAGLPLLPEAELLESFRDFCRQCWQASHELVAAAKEKQGKRKT